MQSQLVLHGCPVGLLLGHVLTAGLGVVLGAGAGCGATKAAGLGPHEGATKFALFGTMHQLVGAL